MISELADLYQWLDGFPASSMVELDYGSVALLFEEEDLVSRRIGGRCPGLAQGLVGRRSRGSRSSLLLPAQPLVARLFGDVLTT